MRQIQQRALAALGRGRRGYLVDCSKVYVKADRFGGAGSFAAVPIKKGELVEKGIVRRLPVDGNLCPYVFTWSENRSVWASGSGCSVFYNACTSGLETTEMKRYLDEDRFEIFALRDIERHEELTHLYKSMEWRKCFADLREPAGAVSEDAFLPTSEENLVDCSKVEARPDGWGGAGVYAKVPIKRGELVEKGIVRRLPVDGNECPYVFTWSEDKSVWASGSGCSVFYNASLDGSENTEVVRNMDQDRFEIFALRDIEKGEELTHLYKSIEWRNCFKDLKALRARTGAKDLGKERADFTEYWASDHSAATLENMLLDSDAASIDKLERPEILSHMPSLNGKSVLELGAGIGRFSGILAKKAQRVLAVDFVHASCEENKRANADKPNVQVLQADVTTLNLAPGSFDLVFSNWLFMYLTDEECAELARNILTWLRPGGHIYMRESCFHASGSKARRFNPTKYRTPEQYSQFFSDALGEDGMRFQLCGTNFVESYAQLKGNMHQFWFRWQKVNVLSPIHLMTLQTGQYSPAKILRYEKIYGRGYVYTGGDEISKKIMELCREQLHPGARCLDLGAGAGGTAYYLTENCPVYVHAVNWSSELASVNAGRQHRIPGPHGKRVTFELIPESGVPENEMRYPPNTFDVVVVRETLMYLEKQDKAVVLRKVARMLRPGGKVVVIDYCAGRKREELSPEFRNHIERWHYELLPAQEVQDLLENYFEVESRDHTEDFVRYMDEGLGQIEANLGPESWGSPDHIAKLLEGSLEGRLLETMTDLPEDVASEACHAALEKVELHKAGLESSMEAQKADYEWARDTWTLEKESALKGDLKWHFFVATKPAL